MNNDTPSQSLIDVSARLRAAFRTRPIDDRVLKEVVCEYVDEAQLLGWPIERVIIEIKRVLDMEEGPLRRADPFDRAEGQRMVERVVTWCVEHYYRA